MEYCEFDEECKKLFEGVIHERGEKSVALSMKCIESKGLLVESDFVEDYGDISDLQEDIPVASPYKTFIDDVQALYYTVIVNYNPYNTLPTSKMLYASTIDHITKGIDVKVINIADIEDLTLKFIDQKTLGMTGIAVPAHI